MKLLTPRTVLAAVSLFAPTVAQAPDSRPYVDGELARCVRDANEFALELHRHLGEGNTLCSPYSIRAAFSMCWAATDGRTHAEIGEVLRLTQEPEVLHRAMAELERRLEGAQGEDLQLHVAGRLWGGSRERSDYYRPEYLDLMRRHYDAGFGLVDFGRPEAARVEINGWVSGQTATRIPDLLPKGSLDGGTVMVITNAVYFRGMWSRPFDPEATGPAPFQVSTEETVDVPTMHGTGQYEVAALTEAGVLALPYAGGELRMLVFVPALGRLAELERALSPELLERAREALRERMLRVALPKFELTTEYRLHEQALPDMGMAAPFRLRDDWAPLNGGVESLAISGVYHDAMVEVGEEGTEAAAATGIVIKRGGRPQEFAVDRPFVFAIEHASTGLILFLGRVTDPSPATHR